MLHTRGSIFKFLKLFQVATVVAHNDIFRLASLVLETNRLLAMAKDIAGLHTIAVSKVFFQIINHSIVLQLRRSLQEHLSPHQFGVSTLGGCGTIMGRDVNQH